MARPIETQLYRELVDSGFQFIERGIKEIHENIIGKLKLEFLS
jgi:hypothetical protein